MGINPPSSDAKSQRSEFIFKVKSSTDVNGLTELFETQMPKVPRALVKDARGALIFNVEG